MREEKAINQRQGENRSPEAIYTEIVEQIFDFSNGLRQIHSENLRVRYVRFIKSELKRFFDPVLTGFIGKCENVEPKAGFIHHWIFPHGLNMKISRKV